MPKFFLVMQRGTEIGKKIPISKHQFTIGRNADNDIVLNDPLVSRYHTVIQADQNGTARIIDLNSTNGVLVNETKLEPGAPRFLVHRDVIYVGSSVFNLQIRPDNYNPITPSSADPSDVTQVLEYVRLYS